MKAINKPECAPRCETRNSPLGIRQRRGTRAFVVRCCLALGLAIAVGPVLFAPSRASAQEDALSEARVKFQQAIELEQAGNYAGALKLFRDVGQVKLTPQIRYHIAVCEEHLGHLVAALGGYELALSHSEGMHPDFIAEVEASITELNARIPKLVIERGEGADAAVVEFDGVALGDAQIGVEIPINPGPHAVVAKSPGYERFQQTIEVEEGTTETLTLELTALPPPPPPVATTAAPQEPQSFGALPYVIGGSGAALAILGGAFLGVSASKVADLKKKCGGDTVCSNLMGDELEQGKKQEKAARTFETVGWAGLGIGVAALAAGTALFIVDKRRNREMQAKTFRIVPAAPQADAGFSLHGSF